MRWAGHVAQIRETRNTYKIFVVQNLKGRHHLGILGINVNANVKTDNN